MTLGARSTAPASMFSAMNGMTMAGRPPSPYEDSLLLVAAASTAGIAPAIEMQSRTAEMHYKVDSLEQDLRWGEALRRARSRVLPRIGLSLG